MWGAANESQPVLAAEDRLREGPPDRFAVDVAESRVARLELADVFEKAVADRQPDALAQRQGGRSTTWREFDQR